MRQIQQNKTDHMRPSFLAALAQGQKVRQMKLGENLKKIDCRSCWHWLTIRNCAGQNLHKRSSISASLMAA